jgi:DNA-nicking Smr family endonuclease
MTRKPDRDAVLWQRVTRDVKRLAPRSPLRPIVAKPPEKRAARSAPPAPPTAPLPPLAGDQFAGIDRANVERLKRGKHPIEARLDLHGMTQDEAHRALAAFIRRSRAGGKRCVLVITGRGTLGSGILRTAVPRWLDEPEFRPHLLAIATAQPRDGGAGAIYVMLRRTRTAERS